MDMGGETERGTSGGPAAAGGGSGDAGPATAAPSHAISSHSALDPVPATASSPPPPDVGSSPIDVDASGLVLQTIRTAEPPKRSPAPLATDQVLDGITEHLETIDQVCKKYGTHVDVDRIEASKGITSVLAVERLKAHGKNEIQPPEKANMFLKFLSEIFRPLSIPLLVASVLSFILFAVDAEREYFNLWLGVMLLVTTLGNGALEFVQRMRAEAILTSFKCLVPQQTVVIRGGQITAVPAVDIVVGDLINVKSGDKLPADVRIVWSNELMVEHALLTGEDEPQIRNPDIGVDNPLEADNLGFKGTPVVSGEGYAIVIRTGQNTLLGSIQQSRPRARVKRRQSPLSMEIQSFVTIIAITGSVLAIAFWIAGMIINPSFIQNFRFLVGLFVANVPQGLPLTVSMLLTFAARRLSTHNVLVKDLEAVDTLGSITLLASDKTGTITQNRMTVVNVWMNKKHYRTLEEEGQFPTSLLKPSDPGHDRLIKLLALNRKAFFEKNEENLNRPLDERKILGDATESGILRFVASRVRDISVFETEFRKVFEIPFTSETRWALTINYDPHENGELTLYIKGAPERIMRLCSKVMYNDRIVEVSEKENWHDDFTGAYEKLASQGQRVLGLAYLPLPGSKYSEKTLFANRPGSFPTRDYVFVGLIGLMDPPKPKVSKAVASCQTAGITVMMVTGDHPLTAEAIARQIGLVIGDTKEQAAKRLGRDVSTIEEHEYRAVVVHGDDLDTLTNQEWDMILAKREVVFARTSPRQKLEIVARCQAKGHVVGVTGDGFNDSPALQRADLGISMGITGSDVSKDAAAMILLDDNFTSIVEGIAQGRLIFTNLKKSIMYTLCHITPELVPFLLFIILAIPLPLSAFLILTIDLATELPSAVSLAWEVEETNLMKAAPRRTIAPKEQLLVKESEVHALSRVPSFHVEEIDASHLHRRRGRGGMMARFESMAVFRRLSKLKFKKAHPDDETLVDRQLLIWSYLQTGLIEAIGALGNYYLAWYLGVEDGGQLIRATPADLLGHRDFEEGTEFARQMVTEENYRLLVRKSNAAYFVTIVISQMFCLYVVKVSGLPCGTKMFWNHRTYVASLISWGVALAIIHIPGLNLILVAAPIRWENYAVAFATGVAIVVYNIVGVMVSRVLVRHGVPVGARWHEAEVIEGVQKTLTREPYKGGSKRQKSRKEG